MKAVLTWFVKRDVEDLFIFALSVATMVVVSGFIFIVTTDSERSERLCQERGKIIGMETRYEGGNLGCFVRVGEHWIPYEKWRP